MYEYDDAVLKCFLANQTKLFSEKVAETMEEAEEYLQDSLAVVLDSPDEVAEYLEESGADIDGMSIDEVLQSDEVFAVGDGRYIVLDF